MNDELVKWLRDCGNDSVGCGGCPYKGRLMDGNCINGLLAEAADAIEELSRKNESLAKSVNEASESLPQRRPVARGTWVFYNSFSWKCPHCGWINYHNAGVPNVYNFCHNCGADMREES